MRFVRETNLDFALAEEVLSSAPFLRFLLDELGLDRPGEPNVAAEPNHIGHNGETDLRIQMDWADHRLVLLVEDKIDAAFQPAQPERYTARAAAEDADTALTVLVAPASYLASSAGLFDRAIPFERIADHFRNRGEMSEDPEQAARLLFRADLFQRACVDRWTAVRDDATTAIWATYADVVRERAPMFTPPPVRDRPTTSSFVYVTGALPSTGSADGPRLVHKLCHGFVDLQFSGSADAVDDARARWAPLLPPGCTIEQAAKTW